MVKAPFVAVNALHEDPGYCAQSLFDLHPGKHPFVEAWVFKHHTRLPDELMPQSVLTLQESWHHVLQEPDLHSALEEHASPVRFLAAGSAALHSSAHSLATHPVLPSIADSSAVDDVESPDTHALTQLFVVQGPMHSSAVWQAASSPHDPHSALQLFAKHD